MMLLMGGMTLLAVLLVGLCAIALTPGEGMRRDHD